VPLDNPVAVRFIQSLGIEPPEYVYQGTGCPLCNDTGYRGRTVVEEVMLFTKDIRRAIDDGAHESELLEIAIRGGMETLPVNAVDKLVRGVTTTEELLRTVYSVENEGVI